MPNYLPEGLLSATAENKNCLKSVYNLQECATDGKILEARATMCDSDHNLIVDLNCMRGIIPRTEGALGIDVGTTRDIALISRVNKPVCFKVLAIETDVGGQPRAILSRRAVQQECMQRFIGRLRPGDIIPARVTHLEQFGCFVDIGCGIPSLIPIDAISVSRISHPSDRFSAGDDIFVVVKSVEPSGRICLSHKELLGTWEENAALFNTGETVAGIVRSVEEYGIFIELTPNLAGLAEPRKGVRVGQCASVYIKAIIPDKMKVKLIIVDVFDRDDEQVKSERRNMQYFLSEGHLSSWRYSSTYADKLIETVF